MKKKHILKLIITFFILLVSEVALLTLVNIIPQKYIKSNVKEASATLHEEGLFPIIDNNFILDNWTDTIMINTAYSVDTKKPLESAILMRRNYRKDVNLVLKKQTSQENPLLDLQETLEERNISYYEYSRYWHGYMIYLRPLLAFLNYSQIRKLLIFVISSLSLLLIVLTYKKINIVTSILTTIILLLSRFRLTGMSLQYSSAFIIMLLASIYLLLRYDKMDKYRYFFVIGCLTCFFDLFTVPLITLGIPLIYYIMLTEKRNNIIGIKGTLRLIIMWFLGYGLMWTSKWIISDLFFNTRTIDGAIQKITSYTINTDKVNINIFQSIKSNILAFNQTFLIRLIIIYSAIMGVATCIYNHKGIKNNIPYIIIVLLPFIWYALVKNHSYVHARFTYRILLVSVFGLLVLTVKNYKEG